MGTGAISRGGRRDGVRPVLPDPTASVSLHILDAYPAEHYGGQEPFDEFALQEVTFFGIQLEDDSR